MTERSNKEAYLSGRVMKAEDRQIATEAVDSEFEVFKQILGPKMVEFRCAPCSDTKLKFDRLLRNLGGTGYVPFMSGEREELVVRVEKENKIEGDQKIFTKKHLLLFLTTIATTLWVGASMFGVDLLSSPLAIWRGWPYTLAIMGVLGVHELGHYLMSNKRGVVATLPYFIPIPFALGTLGAVIRMKSPMPDRKSMFDIGIAGPLLGLAAAIPITVIGLIETPLHPPAGVPLLDGVGKPLIFQAAVWLVSPGKGILHPVAFAGWVGFLITFLNLLPVGQLDGGHVSRALLGGLYHRVSRVVPLFLFSLGFFLTFFLGAGGALWIFWGFIVTFFHAAGHPPPLDGVTPLDLKRKLVGCLVFALMLACFVPVPFPNA